MNRLKISIKRALPFIFALFLSIPFLTSCDNDDSDSSLVGDWARSSDFDGDARYNAVSFVIGDYAYVGTGYNASGKKKFKDFYRFDGSSWQKIAEFPGAARYQAVAFAANNKGYVGLGWDGTTYFKDFYEYDPTTDTWSEIAEIKDFGGSARIDAMAFGIGNKGYVSSGYDGSYLKDFWEYNTETGEWKDLKSNPGSKQRYGSAFVLDGKGYILGGIDSDGAHVSNFFRFNPESADYWEKLRNISNTNTDETYDDKYTTILRYDAVAFADNGKAYFATGSRTSPITEIWEYEAAGDVWTQKTSFEGTAREGATGFSIKGRFFVALGNSGGATSSTWEFLPNDEVNKNNNN